MPEGMRQGEKMKLASLILGVLAATFLLFGGCAAVCTGLTAQSIGEKLDWDPDASGEGSSTDEIIGAGFLAVISSLLLYIGAGLAFAARRTSTVFIAVGLIFLLGGVSVDNASAFNFAYWPSLILAIAATIVSIIAWRREQESPVEEHL